MDHNALPLADAVYDAAPLHGVEVARLLDLLQPRQPRFRAAVYIAAWGVAGVISTTVPNLAANRDHVMMYFLLLMVGLLLVIFTLAAPNWRVAERGGRSPGRLGQGHAPELELPANSFPCLTTD